MSLTLCSVVRVHPSRRTADLVDTSSGARTADVPILGNVSSNAGSWAVPRADAPSSERQAGGLGAGRNLMAVVGRVHGRAVVLGFFSPSGGWSVAEDDREVHVHPSGAYTTIAPDGSIETYHPSGACFRIGTGGHAAVPGVPAPGGGAAPTITLASPNFSLVIAPDGTVTMNSPTTITLAAAESMTVNTPDLTLNAAVTINGPLHQGTGTAGGAATIQGPVTVVNDLTAAGTSVHGHEHREHDGPLTTAPV